MGLPLPGETILVLAAIYAATESSFNVGVVIAVAAFGAIVGDNAGYWLGLRYGYALLLRYGKRIGMFEARIKLGQYLFLKHGAKVVFLGRFVALLRMLAAFLAGVNRMPWRAFLVANACGGIIWAAVFGIGGYFFGKLLLQLHHALAPKCSRSRSRLSLDVVTWSDATKIGLQHRPNARYPAPLWPRSTRKDHKPYSAIISEGAIWNIWRARGCIHVEETRVHHAARRRGGVAARGACTAGGKVADHWFARRDHFNPAPMDRRFCPAAARTWLDRAYPLSSGGFTTTPCDHNTPLGEDHRHPAVWLVPNDLPTAP
jgi:membrane protein DedA with SNARE-associated domain